MTTTADTLGTTSAATASSRISILRDRIPEIAAIAVALILSLSVWLGARYVEQVTWVKHSLEIRTKITRIWSLLQDAEIGQRSFVLTGDERFLEPFSSAYRRVSEELDELANRVRDNPQQTTALAEARPIITRRLAIAEKTIMQRRQGNQELARATVLEGHGLAAMQDLRDRFGRMLDEEEQLLAMRTEATASTITVLSAAILAGIITTLSALYYWIMNSRRTARELAVANTALQETIVARDFAEGERAAAEQQIRQMQKMEAVGQLTGGIAHDFNNMLAVVISGITLAQRRLAAGRAGAEELLGNALDGAHRAANLVGRLLAFARQQPLAPKAVDANKFVAALSEMIARALGESIRMETILGGGLWTTHADPAQLETSILNLCVNARDAMPDGGRLTLETANCHLDDRYSRLHPDVPAGQYVLIAVTDTGLGMTPAIAAKAFEPFFTTKETGKGTGLGLSQVFGFVKQSGGHVKIYSEPGQGTTVKIYLPRYYGTVDGDRVSIPTKEIKGTETILLVEDDPSVLALTAAGLGDLGYTVLEARHASQALTILAARSDVDLLLTDIVMPDMNGRKLAEQATRLHPDLRVMFMTGFTKNAVVHNGVLDPGVHFLAKPFTLEELSCKVREALDTQVKG